MIGILIWIVIGIICIWEWVINAVHDASDRDNAIRQGRDWYMDNKGVTRSVHNNHRIELRGTDKNGDVVKMDMVTKEVLHNYSQDERDEKAKEAQYYRDKTNKSKKEAIEKGAYAYRSWEIVTEYMSPRYGTYDITIRRISDNLELESAAFGPNINYVDKKYRFLVYRDVTLYEECPMLFSLQEDIDSLFDDINYLVEFRNLDKDMLIEYAKRIKAIGWEKL